MTFTHHDRFISPFVSLVFATNGVDIMNRTTINYQVSANTTKYQVEHDISIANVFNEDPRINLIHKAKIQDFSNTFNIIIGLDKHGIPTQGKRCNPALFDRRLKQLVGRKTDLQIFTIQFEHNLHWCFECIGKS